METDSSLNMLKHIIEKKSLSCSTLYGGKDNVLPQSHGLLSKSAPCPLHQVTREALKPAEQDC